MSPDNSTSLVWSGLYLGSDWSALAPGRPEGPPTEGRCRGCDFFGAIDLNTQTCPDCSKETS